MTETELIAACRQGSSRAQKQLYEQFAGLMLSVCLRYLRRREDAEEALIVGFTKVFRALDQYRHEGSFEGWIRRIVVNEALGHAAPQGAPAHGHRRFDLRRAGRGR